MKFLNKRGAAEIGGLDSVLELVVSIFLIPVVIVAVNSANVTGVAAALLDLMPFILVVLIIRRMLRKG